MSIVVKQDSRFSMEISIPFVEAPGTCIPTAAQVKGYRKKVLSYFDGFLRSFHS